MVEGIMTKLKIAKYFDIMPIVYTCITIYLVIVLYPDWFYLWFSFPIPDCLQLSNIEEGALQSTFVNMLVGMVTVIGIVFSFFANRISKIEKSLGESAYWFVVDELKSVMTLLFISVLLLIVGVISETSKFNSFLIWRYVTFAVFSLFSIALIIYIPFSIIRPIDTFVVDKILDNLSKTDLEELNDKRCELTKNREIIIDYKKDVHMLMNNKIIWLRTIIRNALTANEIFLPQYVLFKLGQFIATKGHTHDEWEDRLIVVKNFIRYFYLEKDHKKRELIIRPLISQYFTLIENGLIDDNNISFWSREDNVCDKLLVSEDCTKFVCGNVFNIIIKELRLNESYQTYNEISYSFNNLTDLVHNLVDSVIESHNPDIINSFIFKADFFLAEISKDEKILKEYRCDICRYLLNLFSFSFRSDLERKILMKISDNFNHTLISHISQPCETSAVLIPVLFQINLELEIHFRLKGIFSTVFFPESTIYKRLSTNACSEINVKAINFILKWAIQYLKSRLISKTYSYKTDTHYFKSYYLSNAYKIIKKQPFPLKTKILAFCVEKLCTQLKKRSRTNKSKILWSKENKHN